MLFCGLRRNRAGVVNNGPRHALGISYLLFADDTMLFLEATEEQSWSN
jgi:hypothetical protein